MAPANLVTSSSSESGSGSEDAFGFKVNEQFAEKYEQKKRGEELSKLQDKYGKDYQLPEHDDESTDYSTDDEAAELVTPEVDAAILRTLAKIRARDPSVYEQGREVFEEEERQTAAARSNASSSRAKSSSSKPVLLKDFQRARLLANPEGDDSLDTPSSLAQPTPAEEARLLQQETKAAFLGTDADDSDDEDEDGFLRKREKGEDERVKEEKEYEKFLETTVGKKAVKEALGEEDAFLRDYILNRGWIDRENESHIPSYDEIVGDDDGDDKPKKKRKTKSALLDEDGHILDPSLHDDVDDEFEEKAEEFEHRYNFRFEENGAADIVTHSRSVGATSVRKPTTAVSARARAREAAKERKEQEKLQRKEELNRLKALRRKEIEGKLQQLVEAAGEGTKGLEEIDLDGEWDEAKHDEAMRKVYGDDYDNMEDADFKPTWDDDIDITDIVGPDASDDGDMPIASTSALPADGDVEMEEAEEPVRKKSKKDKKGKRKGEKRDEDGLPTELIETVKASGDSTKAEEADRILDEYYALDYEDKIGDIKTRFKYAKVPAQSFNLTPEEILLATDAELNAFMSLKKMAPYRQDSAPWQAKQAQKQRKKLKELREVLRNRKWGEEVDEEQAKIQLEKRKEKKRRYTERKEAREAGENGVGDGLRGADGEPAKKKKRAGKSERKRLKEQAGAGGGGGEE
ncbi:KRR1 interacting protein 1 [Rhodotorula toruloides]|uniref:KRR1 interacting protein 1 n=1 Tax=Rhodotorula toruloides TaxID=5286 RepID=A0A511KAA7_RHOTO|nr:KRR1 interacting protein 1 [Rhodotorula toruloides]